MKEQDWTSDFVEFIRRTATDLPRDVEARIKECYKKEDKSSIASNILDALLKNTHLARKDSTPICQDTGYPTFYICLPVGVSQISIENQIRKSLKICTKKCYLRPNSVNSISGKNEGMNTGLYFPTIYFKQWKKDSIDINLILKGGGCENVGMQYKLPDERLGAGRDLDGVSKCIINMVMTAQGRGCAPGTLGVGLGGDRAVSYSVAKKQFLRKFNDKNYVPELARLESVLLEKINKLGIGPMGMGGNTTIMGLKIGAAHRLPACYFVSISYMCWAYRRRNMKIDSKGSVHYEKN